MPMFTFREVDRYIWEIPRSYRHDMRVPVRIYATKQHLDKMTQDRTVMQGVNVATLPGIQKFSIILPDGHQGYGFPIGGVAAVDSEEGVISPGGVGYDINCGVRVIKTNLDYEEVKPKIKELADILFKKVPAGLGSRRRDFNVTRNELDKIAIEGARYIIRKFGLGWEEDIERIEEYGAIEGADPSYVSDTAKRRGLNQIGTLGSGNHFLEIQVVDKIFNIDMAKAMGITYERQVVIMVHCGSRGYGHQVCSDYLKVMDRAIRKYGIKLPDRELAYAPIKSPETQQYLKAFKSAVNFAFANRQAISHWVRQGFEKVFKTDADKLGMEIIYDVAHNIVKPEEHVVNGKRKLLFVHRKGATRSLPKEHPLLPKVYKSIGQPVLIPGSMGTPSYILIGHPQSLERSFASAPHGSGRLLSRSAAKRMYRGEQIIRELTQQGVIVRADSMATVTEEVQYAYKDSNEVALVAEVAGLAYRAVRMKPIAVVKG